MLRTRAVRINYLICNYAFFFLIKQIICIYRTYINILQIEKEI